MPLPTSNSQLPASGRTDLAILHVALNPITGPWSVMRDLAMAQTASGKYAKVAIGVIASKGWPEPYAVELAQTGLRSYRAKTIQAFGTAQFLWQRVHHPPINFWIDDLLAESGADRCLVHFHNAWMSGVFLPLNAVRQGRAAVVATFHGVNARLDGRPVRRRLHRWMAARLPRHGARLTSVDQANLTLAQSVLGLDPNLFTVIPNGVPDIVGLRCNAWTGAGEFLVGHVGSITERKGWRIGVEAVLQLRAAGRNIRLLVAGSGPEEAAARELARAHPEAMEFLGYVADPRRNLLPRLHALSVMSAHEGLPMSIIEAMSCGLPVIATEVGGIPEAISHRETGFLVPRSSLALAEAVAKLYESPETWLAFGTATHEKFERRFEIKQIMELYDKIYMAAE